MVWIDGAFLILCVSLISNLWFESKINFEDWKKSIYAEEKWNCPLVVTVLKGNPIEQPIEPERINLRSEADNFWNILVLELKYFIMWVIFNWYKIS